jgi:hypothetical protein
MMRRGARVSVVAVLLASGASCGDDTRDAETSKNEGTTSMGPADGSTTRSSGAETEGTSHDGTTSITTSPESSATASTTAPATTGSPTEPCPPLNADETGVNALTGNNGFSFSDTPYCDYVQIDRVAVPLMRTLLIKFEAYATTTPEDDHAPTPELISEIVTELGSLNADLGAALTSAGLTPCAVGSCYVQVTPLLFRVGLRVDPGAPFGFRNGRRLDDPVPDLVLARMLLDLQNEEADHDAFAQLPLNPPANDVPFDEAWPYLAEPH